MSHILDIQTHLTLGHFGLRCIHFFTNSTPRRSGSTTGHTIPAPGIQRLRYCASPGCWPRIRNTGSWKKSLISAENLLMSIDVPHKIENHVAISLMMMMMTMMMMMVYHGFITPTILGQPPSSQLRPRNVVQSPKVDVVFQSGKKKGLGCTLGVSWKGKRITVSPNI